MTPAKAEANTTFADQKDDTLDQAEYSQQEKIAKNARR
jgi:hypothetical protein